MYGVGCDVHPVCQVPNLVDVLLEVAGSCFMVCDGDHDVICCSVAFLSCDAGLVELWSVIGVACCFDGLTEVVKVRAVSSGCAGKAVQ